MIPIVLLMIGLVAGSFVNMLAWRMPNGISLKGRSICTHCRHVLGVLDLIPVASFFILRSQCRYCSKKIGWRYPFVELTTSFLFLSAWYIQPNLFSTALNSIFILFTISVLVLLFIVDYEYQILPDSITIPSILFIVLLRIIQGGNLGSYILGALVAGGFFAVQYVVSKGRWIGGGDIRFGILMGVIFGWPITLVALVVSYVIGALFGLLLVGLGKAQLTSKTPFGAYLSIAAFITLLYGQNIINWYLRLCMKI